MTVEMHLDLDFSLDFEAIPADDVDLLSLDRQPERAISEIPTDGNGTLLDRPYHPKRPHKKSRAGCKQCKTRKVKIRYEYEELTPDPQCDEARPSCRSCTLRRETCVYPTTCNPPPSTAVVPRSRSRTTSSARSSRGSSPTTTLSKDLANTSIVSEPMFRPPAMADETDMKMLWFYTLETYSSFATEGGRSPAVDHCLRVKVVEHAFASPFLMQCLMGLSALQLKGLGQDIDPSKAVGYRARAFEGYRAAIEAADPKDFPALLASSLMMCALSTQMFREANSKFLYIVDWMQLWRGIGLIVEIISPKSIEESGLAILFYRPPMDLEKSFRHIPNNFLLMVSSIKPGDDDYEHQQIYYEVLRYLGSLYMELENGFGPVLDLRVITFLTFMPRPFIPLAQEHRPRTLVILAHYLCFAKLNTNVWWMQGIADPQLKEICDFVGESWSHLLRVPYKVMGLTDKTDIARVLLNNDNWLPPDIDLYNEHRDPRTKDLRFRDNLGRETMIVDGQFKVKAERPSPTWNFPGDTDASGSEAVGTPDSERIRELIGEETFGIGHPLNPSSRPSSVPRSPATSSTESPAGSA
ncbi:hypothetical protein PG994_002159 [Apiospora phragmitis]|uniref:Zn(2)-C6 fungal-type domain-containing protein n=1 Tax=Apiospora phragmitis TaxID=2905665 RepID=A0ABR1WVL6_9PEZI